MVIRFNKRNPSVRSQTSTFYREVFKHHDRSVLCPLYWTPILEMRMHDVHVPSQYKAHMRLAPIAQLSQYV